MAIRISGMIVRYVGLLTLILGILFWTNTIKGVLVPIHMLLGILLTLALWVMGAFIFNKKGGAGLGASAIVLGLLLLVLGLTQQSLLVGSSHWIIQVVHLLVGLAAIGLGEAISARYRRLNKATVLV